MTFFISAQQSGVGKEKPEHSIHTSTAFFLGSCIAESIKVIGKKITKISRQPSCLSTKEQKAEPAARCSVGLECWVWALPVQWRPLPGRKGEIPRTLASSWLYLLRGWSSRVLFILGVEFMTPTR